MKKEEDPQPTPPYYQFTPEDLQWLKFNTGDLWVFANASGKQQQYVIDEIKREIKQSYMPSNFGGIIAAPPKTTYYYDKVEFAIRRLDTLAYNRLEFRKSLPAGADDRNPPNSEGEFDFGGLWRNYLGGPVFEGVYGNLNVQPSQLLPQISSPLDLNGRHYKKVIMISTDLSNEYKGGKSYIRTIYYSQEEGIIRMISASGEIWDRQF
ncbi:hypothetical protein [Hymenobacter wooponensis]|uniref:Uncharacterized protein n=1 Tax=Hymenobacter wooponensis TaxID=1525360 RepID=A0A4Z0MUR2_9BACT|nr:hypothetical protein [Hymenobacter wooponensis]TGD83200.1 hypothetical protein EU557_05320 [Hymenobacter wooponensis]